MKFSDFVSSKAICTKLAANDKQTAIAELVDALIAAGDIAQANRDDIVRALLNREELGSTGLGRGIAIPHTRHPSVEKAIATIGISAEGVNFDSLDGNKVQLFVMVLSPPIPPTDHHRTLTYISSHLRDQTLCRLLKQSKSTEDILQLLEDADNMG